MRLTAEPLRVSVLSNSTENGRQVLKHLPAIFFLKEPERRGRFSHGLRFGEHKNIAFEIVFLSLFILWYNQIEAWQRVLR